MAACPLPVCLLTGQLASLLVYTSVQKVRSRSYPVPAEACAKCSADFRKAIKGLYAPLSLQLLQRLLMRPADLAAIRPGGKTDAKQQGGGTDCSVPVHIPNTS